MDEWEQFESNHICRNTKEDTSEFDREIKIKHNTTVVEAEQ